MMAMKGGGTNCKRLQLGCRKALLIFWRCDYQVSEQSAEGMLAETFKKGRCVQLEEDEKKYIWD